MYQKLNFTNGSSPAINGANLRKIEDALVENCPAGAMTMWPSKWEPDGWMVRDGSELSRATYVDMYDNLTNPRTVTVTIASPAVFSLTGHGFTAGDPIRFETTGALPTGLNTTTTYYVIAAGLTADAFEVSTSVGGAAVNTSGTQSGTHTVRYFGVLGVGDGSTTFTLPDDSAAFERAWDNGAGIDTNRVFGSTQTDAFKLHRHRVYSSNSNSSNCYGMGDSGCIDGLGGVNGGANAFYDTDFASNQLIEDTGGAETRPYNRAYLPIIRY